jgi:hypothetical protein
VILIGLALPLVADDSSRLTVNSTERINAPTPGTIQFDHSIGEIDIEGWDQPDIELTTTKWIEDVHTKGRASAEQRLGSVRATVQRDGSHVVISTIHHKEKPFRHALSWRSNVEITYRVKAPRGWGLVIDHNNRGINIVGMTGDIRATVTKGEITLALPPGLQAIDAKSGFGNVYADFAGTSQRQRLFGKTFARASAQPGRNVYLRVGSGDIVIFQAPGRPAE